MLMTVIYVSDLKKKNTLFYGWRDNILDNRFLASLLEFKHYWPNHAGLSMEESPGMINLRN